MSRRTTRAARARSSRDARRESLLVLIARTQRGSSLSPAEAALLRAHVEAEVDEANRYRAEAGGQATAVRREQQRTRAAEEAIREAEQRAADAEEQLRMFRAVFGEDSLNAYTYALARLSRAEGALEAVRNATGPTSERVAVAEYDRTARLDAEERADRYRLHSEKLRHQLGAAEDRAHRFERDARDNGADLRAERQHAQAAEQQLAAVRAVLPTEPRPRLGLPNTLAYEEGRHDQADAVRDALGEQVRT
ncbi:hypothetical protein [Streptomyces sp. NPDC006645]|uniref:hypothetical protein n=1 Tax=unclassified Streptomyces TaxID=2593676 RepID=UPI0033BF4326